MSVRFLTIHDHQCALEYSPRGYYRMWKRGKPLSVLLVDIDPEKDAEITAITDREERNAAWKTEMQRLEDLIIQQARKEWK